MLPPVSTEPLNLCFQVQYSSFLANLAFACKTETLGSLHSLALLILTKSEVLGSNPISVNILFSEVNPVIPMLVLLPMLGACENLEKVCHSFFDQQT